MCLSKLIVVFELVLIFFEVVFVSSGGKACSGLLGQGSRSAFCRPTLVFVLHRFYWRRFGRACSGGGSWGGKAGTGAEAAAGAANGGQAVGMKP